MKPSIGLQSAREQRPGSIAALREICQQQGEHSRRGPRHDEALMRRPANHLIDIGPGGRPFGRAGVVAHGTPAHSWQTRIGRLTGCILVRDGRKFRFRGQRRRQRSLAALQLGGANRQNNLKNVEGSKYRWACSCVVTGVSGSGKEYAVRRRYAVGPRRLRPPARKASMGPKRGPPAVQQPARA